MIPKVCIILNDGNIQSVMTTEPMDITVVDIDDGALDCDDRCRINTARSERENPEDGCEVVTAEEMTSRIEEYENEYAEDYE